MLSQILYALPFLAEGFAVTLWVSLLVVVLSLIAGNVCPAGSTRKSPQCMRGSAVLGQGGGKSHRAGAQKRILC